MKLMQRKNQFVANIIAASIQNISKQRQDAGAALTQRDIISTIRLAALSVFPGMTQYTVAGGTYAYSRSPLGYIPMVNLCVFSGTGENTATLKYHYRFFPGYFYSNLYSQSHAGNDGSIIKFNEETASSIYPDFQISKDETKCIIDFRFYSDSTSSFPNGTMAKDITKKELFGFLFYNPPARPAYFHAVTIFTPVWNFTKDLP